MSRFTKTSTRTVTLPDDRILSFGLFGAGAEDLPSSDVPGQNHPVIFYFHGFPSSHDEGFVFHQAALKNGIQIIALDRPGHAEATFQPNRRITDWPADVLAVADHLNIEEFGVLGFSGGSPYVFACWKSIPRDRLVAAGICSGLYPPSLGLGGMLVQGRAILTLGPWLPGVVAWGMEWMFLKAARDDEHPEELERIILEDLKSRPAVDRAVLDPDANGIRSAMISSVRDAIRPGGKGPAHDVKLAGSHWGFELEDLDVSEGMVWWHGAEDINVPVTMAKKASKIVPGAELRLVEGEGHISIAAHKSDEIMSTLGSLLSRK
ncbi:alpha beta hydrolase fold protein [Colletotrichum karsti]|uniref:Alpha beta hydrolase fold protein n=1 Tax=Colletotrichum karsti TaxID=1095194 RepID=A0A9P6HTX0_9PEZI|nr:alpha beta hydrolase fold protein [Colletotrichum karsti]KAF9869662.1 alpha beta hydrolase fold protein [Colletotrichum karsti]